GESDSSLDCLQLIGICSFRMPLIHTLPDIENAHFIEECVSVHNRFRSSVDPPASNMKRMSWDHDLAKTALGWANRCQFNHNPDLKSPGKAHPNFTAVGENIWTGSIWYFNVTSALTNWYDEVQYYNYATQRCKDVCGHYTQMVWAKTYKVGCAVHFCPIVQGFGGSNAAHFICDYGPGMVNIFKLAGESISLHLKVAKVEKHLLMECLLLGHFSKIG
uniref:SCP domain-containing protein n=1 Tax=Naja naja TaxID=35670 RepID=A0A8C7DRJ6_NAJNA